MRLDHLLSKEHSAPRPVFGSSVVVSRAMPRTFASGVVLTGGTLASGLCVRGSGRVQLGVAPSGVLLVGKAAGRGGVVEARCWVLREQP